MATAAVDPAQFAANRLSPAEWEQFSTHGFLIVKNAISEATGNRLRQLLHNMHTQLRASGSYTTEQDVREAVFSRTNQLQEDPDVLALLTQPTVFPKICDIMGSNIYCWHNFSPCTLPAPPGTAPPKDFESVPKFGFHRDGGFENFFSERPAPRLTVKAIYYLSDQSEPGRGETWVVPGSHLVGSPAADGVAEVAGLGKTTGQPAGAIPVLCPPNSALLFDRRLLHAGTPNFSSEHERLLFIIGWGYRWLRARDPLYVEPALSRARCPILRQLLGVTSSQAGLIRPGGADTPLQQWLVAHKLASTAGGGQGRGHPGNTRWRGVGEGSPVMEVAVRMRQGDIGGHSTRPRHSGRASLRVEPPSNPLQSGRRNGPYPKHSVESKREQANPHVTASLDESTTLALVQLNPDAWGEHALSAKHSQDFDADGFLVLNEGQQVLKSCERVALRERAGRLQCSGDAYDSAGRATFLFCAGVEPPPEVVRRLLANEAVLPSVLGLLRNYNITCLHACLRSLPRLGSEQDRLQQELLGWIDRDLECRPAPRVALTAIFGLGNPGSSLIKVLRHSHHLEREPPAQNCPAPEDVCEILVPEGGCVLLDRRIWRSITAVCGAVDDGVVAEIGFGARWLRPADPMYTEPLLALGAADDVSGAIDPSAPPMAWTCPVLRQMLGEHSSNAGWWSPNLLDIPLLAWLNHHRISYVPDESPQLPPMSIAPAWAYGDGTKGDDGHSSAPREVAMDARQRL
jgi:ectoine hydroxylase